LIADDVINLYHGGKTLRIDLRGAAGHDDLGVRVLAPRLANGLTSLAHALLCDGASVDDHRRAEGGVGGMLAHDFGLVSSEPARERADFDLRPVATSNTKLGNAPTPTSRVNARFEGGSGGRPGACLHSRARKDRSSSYGHRPRASR